MNSSSLTVLTPATSYDLTTLAIAKEELDIADDSIDTMLARWITESSAVLAGHCGRVFGLETVVETFSMRRLTEWSFPTDLLLRRYPVASVASVVEGTESPLDETSDFEVEAEAGILRRLTYDGSTQCLFSSGVAVTYTGGYSLPDGVDPLLRQACLLMLKHRLGSRSRDPMLRQVDIPGVISKTYWVGTGPNGLPPEVESLVAGFMETGRAL